MTTRYVLFLSAVLFLAISIVNASSPTCPTNGGSPGAYQCQQATVPDTLSNGTVITVPQLTNCKNNTAYLCGRGAPSFAGYNGAIGTMLALLNTTADDFTCAADYQDFICFVLFPPCNTTNTSNYNQLCYSECLSLLNFCWNASYPTTNNATCYNLAYNGIGTTPGEIIYPVAKIGDSQCVSTYVPRPKPRYNNVIEQPPLDHLIRRSGLNPELIVQGSSSIPSPAGPTLQ